MAAKTAKESRRTDGCDLHKMQRLMSAGRKGNQMNKEQFTAEVLGAEKSLYHIAWSILGNDEDCADAMQNAILKAFEKLQTLRREEFFRTWITRILMNECYSMIRSKKVQVPYEDYFAEQVQTQEKSDSGVVEAVKELESKYRIPIVMYYVEGFSVREISRTLQISEGAVKTRLYRGRNLIKASMTGECGYEK